MTNVFLVIFFLLQFFLSIFLIFYFPVQLQSVIYNIAEL